MTDRKTGTRIGLTRFTIFSAISAFFFLSDNAAAFTANISASPDPNTGDYTVTWSNPAGYTYVLQQMNVAAGSWSTITSTTQTSYAFSGVAAGDYLYRLKWGQLFCAGWPEPECVYVYWYSETTSVTVEEASPPGGGEDPFPPPGTFTPPDDTDFPDGPIINPFVSASDSSPSVGAVQGGGGVSGGQASYNIPIVVPPGRKGAQPNVSLSYSSSSGNGPVGVGWRLNAGSAITRCSATAAQDGFTAAVQYDESRDRLCLDGQRLMVDGTTYGTANSYYRTELESFARIKQFGGLNSGTTYFYVEHKNGLRSWYGSTTESKHIADGRNEILTWALRMTMDRSGNTVLYAYYDHTNGEYNIKEIHYTGFNGSQGDRHVVFEYEPRLDNRTYYLAGGKTRSTQRLKKIVTKYGTTVVREYNLDYGVQSLSTSRSLLRSVEECANKDFVSFCLPKTDLSWQEKTPEYVTEQLQFFDPNNLIPGGTNPEIIHADKRWLHDVIPHGDEDGDGVKDWTDLNVNAEGEITGTHTTNLSNCYRRLNSFYLTCLEADFDADGLTDSFQQQNSKFEIRFAGTSTWINTGLDWNSNSYPALSDAPLGFADFNGDGWVDLAFVQASQLWVYFHTKNLNSPYSTTSRQLIMTFLLAAGGASHTSAAQIHGDMDGNGTPDFVVSQFGQSDEPQGLPRPNHIILTESLSGGSMTTTTRQITGLLEGISVNSHFFHDINGDGLQDLIGIDENNNDKLAYRLNTGTDFEATWKGLGYALPMVIGRYFLNGSEWEIYRSPIMSKVFAMDYDGDGRDDLMVAGSVKASGCGLVYEVQIPSFTRTQKWLCDNDMYDEYQASAETNVGTQINADVKDNSVRQYSRKKFAEDAGGNFSIISSQSDIYASASQTAVFDATGDGLADVVTVLGCRLTEPDGCLFNDQTTIYNGIVDPTYSAEGAWINRNVGTAVDNPTNTENEFEGYDLMNAVEDGLGNRHEWTYRPLSSDAYSTSDSDFYDTTHSYQATDPDYFHFASSMYVVADHRASDGIGGLYSSKYRYRGAIYNNKGRGFQGFKSIIVEEDIYDDTDPLANTDKTSRTDFHQKWPLSSQIEQSCGWVGAGHASAFDDNPNCFDVIAKTTTTSIHNAITAGGARFVAVDDQTVETFDLTYPHANLTTQQTARTYDSVGNVTYESVSHDDDWTTNLTETTNTYTVNEATWWLNKIDLQVVKHNPVSQRHVNSPTIAPGTDLVKELTTQYVVYDLTHRIPRVIWITGNDTPLKQVITKNFGSYGLPISVLIDDDNILTRRSIVTTYSNDGTTYSADGYFPFTVKNSYNHESEQHTDPTHGQPISQWDPNELVITTSYDAFGRVSDVTPPGQPTASQRYFWCGGGTSCPTGASYKIVTYGAGAPESNSYLDQFRREIQSSVKNFADTGFVNVSTTYDERGNQTFVSQPYDLAAGESATIGTRYLDFDALGRLKSKEIDQADGTIFLTSYSFDGLKTSINAGGLTMHRIYNGLEQLVETQDAMSGFTRYAYDGAGNPIVLQDPNAILNPNIASITASFNALGHKQWVDDPNMGLRSFAYNGFGEVISELDANGDEITMIYDLLGRMTDRIVNDELHGKWHFDNTDTYKGLGLLDFEDSQFRDDGSRLQKFYYYSDTTGGSKDLLQVTHRFYENDDQNDFADYDSTYFTDGYYGRPKGMRYPGGASLAYDYSSAGFVTQEKDPVNNVVYRVINSRDSRNQVKLASLADSGSGFEYNYTAYYYPATGQMDEIQVTSGGSTLHHLTYDYDMFGNLETHATAWGSGSSETFTYDDLHRLTESDRTIGGVQQVVVNYTYDPSGNLKSKSDYATTYNYNTSRPNAVASVTLAGGGNKTFGYDGNGNMLTGHDKSLTYNAFNKPASIAKGGITSAFSYGSDLMRYRQEKNTGDTTYYLDKFMEIVTVGSTSDYRHYLSDVAILTKTGDLNDPNPDIGYFYRDRLGSLNTIADESGSAAQDRAFGAFGKPRNGNWSDRATLDSTITDRGFTEHEHLDDFQLIHMNGRAYDYNLGRFMSVDPIIQSPGNSQSMNPYSYIMNNPLAGTDPSGYAACGDSIKEGDVCQVTETETVATTGSRIAKEVSTTYTVVHNGAEIFIAQGANQKTFDKLDAAMIGDRSTLSDGPEMRATPLKIGERSASTYMCGKFGQRCDDEQFLYDPSEPNFLEKSFGDAIGSFLGPTDNGLAYNPFTNRRIDNPAETKVSTGVGFLTLFSPGPKFVGASSSGGVGVQANRIAGNAARDAIAARTGGQIEQNIRVANGLRRVDVLVNTLAIESKVGRTALTAAVRKQIARDIQMLRSGQVSKVQWEFSRSAVTGKVGPTAPLKHKLQQHGIEVVE